MSRTVVHSLDSCIAEVVLVYLGHQTPRHEDRHFPDRSFTLQRPRCCSRLSTRSCWLHSCLLCSRRRSRPGCADSRWVSCAPPDRLLLDHLVPLRFSRFMVLSVASCDVASFTVLCSPWLFAPCVSSTMACLMLSRHPSLSSLTSALICAVLHASLESLPAGCTRECASCALRETTVCASREPFVHHCLSLKAVLFYRLRDSTSVWSAEAFNTTGVVVVRGKTSFVPSLFLSCAAAKASPRMQPNSAVRSPAECRETSLSLSCGFPILAECFEASLPHLQRSSRAPSTSEPSRSLISSMSFARSTHHHVLDLALPLLLSWTFGVRPCMHTVTSFLDLRG